MEETTTRISDAKELLKHSRVIVDGSVFYLAGLRLEDWTRLLENPELSPRGTEPFMVMRDRFEVTLLLEESDWQTMRHAAREARIEGPFRLLTFDIVLDWNVTGFISLITQILSSEGITVGVCSAFSRDHLLVKQEDVGRTVRVLSSYVDEMC